MSRLPAAPARVALIRFAARQGTPVDALGEVLRMDRRTVQRVLHRDWLRSDTADRVAVALGRHPCELWPEWFG